MSDEVHIVWELVSDQYGTEKIIDVYWNLAEAHTARRASGSLRRVQTVKVK